MNHTISGVTDTTDDDGNSGFKIVNVRKTGVKRPYYSRDIFKKLPQEQRDELAVWNCKRKAEQGEEDGSRQENTSRRTKKYREKISTFESQVEQPKASISAATSSSALELPDTLNASNANNPALTRVPRHPTQNDDNR